MDEQEQLRPHPNPKGRHFRTGCKLAVSRWKLLAWRRHKVGRETSILPTQTWWHSTELRNPWQHLSRRQCDAVVLHYYPGFTAQEIGPTPRTQPTQRGNRARREARGCLTTATLTRS